MDKTQGNKQAETKKKPKMKSKWAKREARLKKVRDEEIEMTELDQKILDLDPSMITKFMDIPLSSRTQRALQSCGYITPTEIQRHGIPIALQGQDLLGAAKTGSGKTLAFLIPMLECLWKLKWSSIDGLGALVISPTRELAYQTFEVLCKIGKHHDISAGLIIGGKEVSFEQQRIQKTNIIVCTPGRLLQHMDETPNFDCSNLKMLVLDEADRILDMGFSETVNAIIENLPEERQTLLYSATQTSSVSDLARLSLHDPEYVSVYKDSEASTPQELKQSYVVCVLQDKINFLYSFVKNHLKSKILVFLSSCKQNASPVELHSRPRGVLKSSVFIKGGLIYPWDDVICHSKFRLRPAVTLDQYRKCPFPKIIIVKVKFTYEAFRRLRPGIPLMALYGKQNQIKRVAIYNDFCKKTLAVLFATDIAARGLDFPAVHWVIQLDCPEDANTYIHRAGRTARYQRDGHSLLILLPSEETEMLKELEKKKVPITEIKANPKKLSNVQKKLEGLCVQDHDIKQWAQKSVVSYVRSVYLQSNKKIFNVDELPVEKYAASLGLITAPRIRFLQKAKKKHGHIPKAVDKTKTTNKPPSEILSDGKQDLTNIEQDFLVLRKRNVEISSDNEEDSMENEPNDNTTEIGNKKNKIKTKTTSAKKVLRKNIKVNSKVIFDEDGEPITVNAQTEGEREQEILGAVSSLENGDSPHDAGGIDLKKSSQKLVKQDKLDKREFRDRIKQKHREKRMKNKVKRKRCEEDDEDECVVTLKSAEDDDLDTKIDSDSDNSYRAPPKRSRRDKEEIVEAPEGTLHDDEELALRLLID